MSGAAPRPCVVCGGTRFSPLCQDGDFAWEECGACGIVRLCQDLSFADQVAIQDEQLADRYIRQYGAKLPRKIAECRRRLRWITRRIQGGRFLDVGCNQGYMTEIAASAGFSATGLEIIPAMVRRARELFPDRDFIVSPIETFDPGETLFDAVYCSEVIEHVIDPRGFLRAIARLMRPGGALLLTTPHIREYRRAGYRKMNAPNHKIYFNNANLSRLLGECGFGGTWIRFNPFKGIQLVTTRQQD
jgi:SAM-dependent methyltransferase